MRLAATAAAATRRRGPTRCRSPCRPSPASTPTSWPRGPPPSAASGWSVHGLRAGPPRTRRPAVDAVWRRLGLDAGAAGRVDEAVRVEQPAPTWELARGAPGVAAGAVPARRLRPARADDWGLDVSDWPVDDVGDEPAPSRVARSPTPARAACGTEPTSTRTGSSSTCSSDLPDRRCSTTFGPDGPSERPDGPPGGRAGRRAVVHHARRDTDAHPSGSSRTPRVSLTFSARDSWVAVYGTRRRRWTTGDKLARALRTPSPRPWLPGGARRPERRAAARRRRARASTGTRPGGKVASLLSFAKTEAAPATPTTPTTARDVEASERPGQRADRERSTRGGPW